MSRLEALDLSRFACDRDHGRTQQSVLQSISLLVHLDDGAGCVVARDDASHRLVHLGIERLSRGLDLDDAEAPQDLNE